MTLTPTTKQRLRELREAASGWIETDIQGDVYGRYDTPTEPCNAFYEAAHEAVPALLDENARLRALCLEACRTAKHRLEHGAVNANGDEPERCKAALRSLNDIMTEAGL